jgi:diguanylate cyclase (GGDEF)-like protein
MFDAADSSENNQAQNLLFDAYNSLQKHQNEIEKLFLNNVDLVFNRFRSGNFTEHKPTEDLFQESEMELVAKEDFEEWVSVVSLTRNLESELSSKLHLLENSLSFLAKRYINNEKNPVSPYSLLWSLKKSFSNTDITLQAKKILFTSFHENILGEIDSLLEEINLYLDKKGIVQQAQDKVTEKQQKPHSTQEETTVDTTSPGISKRLADTMSSILGFISNKKTKIQSAQAANTVASKEEIVQSLENISSVGQRSIIQKIEDQLSDENPNGLSGVIDNEIRQTIQVTEQLLGSLQQDSFMNPKIAELIESLKIPLVKEAIHNPMLLNDTSHPGHKLLETIGKLGPYLATEKQSSTTKEFLHNTVEEISRLAEQGTKLDIKQVTNHLEQIIDKRKDSLKSNLGIIAQSCQQEENYRSARTTVYKLLCSKLTHKEIPLVVEQLLHMGWPGLLVHAISTFGEENKNVIRLIGVIDLLLDVFDDGQKLKPMTTIQSEYIIKVIKGGFAKYPLYASYSEQYLARLEAILESGGTKHSDIAYKLVKIDKALIKRLLDQQTTPQPEETPGEEIEKTWLDLVAGIKLDDWIIEQSTQGHARMLNLAWKNQNSTRYVFVDGEGDKRLDTKHHQLAYMFKQRQCSLLEDGRIPIVERAVDRLLKNTFEQIKDESDIDELTGLYRRNALHTKISDLLKITDDAGDQHIVLKMHIDQFGAIVDLYGQKSADKFLKTVSNIVKNYLPKHATLARIGSGKFGALIKNCSPDEGYYFAETQRRALENLRYNWDDEEMPTTFSIGMVHVDSNISSAADALKMASSACQLAIDEGGNCTKLFTANNQDIEKDSEISLNSINIDELLAGNNLALFAQPISAVFLADDEEHHYEILLRVKNGNGSWSGPEELINAAEKSNRMLSVDRWVINQTFSWLENHHDEINNTGISINLSAQSMDDDLFFNFINDHLDSSPFPNNKITFEITESSLIKQVDKARMLVEKIKDKGCKFSLDDFGTGYASYSYLKDFPVDHVKIDGIFIRDILTESSSYAMVKSITDVSHYMGKKVVAEYVESEAILGALRELEVDFAQGHYVGHPVPIKNLIQIEQQN